MITGASSGMGLEIARLAAAEGENSILVARDEEKLDAVAQDLGRRTVVHPIAHDLSEPDAADKVYQAVQRLGVRVDRLVNDAGFGDYGEFVEGDPERQQQMIAVNVAALTAMTRMFLPPMLEAHRGRVMNLASVTGFLPGPLMAVYFATKHYVLAFSESLAEEVRGTGVTVTALCPPPVDTPFVQRARIPEGNYMATTRVTAAPVARFGRRMMERGRTVAVYTLPYKVLTSFLIRITPRFALRRLMHRLNSQR